MRSHLVLDASWSGIVHFTGARLTVESGLVYTLLNLTIFVYISNDKQVQLEPYTYAYKHQQHVHKPCRTTITIVFWDLPERESDCVWLICNDSSLLMKNAKPKLSVCLISWSQLGRGETTDSVPLSEDLNTEMKLRVSSFETLLEYYSRNWKMDGVHWKQHIRMMQIQEWDHLSTNCQWAAYVFPIKNFIWIQINICTFNDVWEQKSMWTTATKETIVDHWREGLSRVWSLLVTIVWLVFRNAAICDCALEQAAARQAARGFTPSTTSTMNRLLVKNICFLSKCFCFLCCQ